MPSNRLRASEWATTTTSKPAGDWALSPIVAAFVLLFVGMTWKWISGAATIPWDAKAHFQPQIQFLAQFPDPAAQRLEQRPVPQFRHADAALPQLSGASLK